MTESVTQHGTDHSSNEEPEDVRMEQVRDTPEAGQDGQKQLEQPETTQPETMAVAHSGIIWTPKFIVLFALVLVSGLSAESLFTQGWIAGSFRSIWILTGHFALLLGLWVGGIFVARSGWVRMGAIFGCFWAIFNCIKLVLAQYSLNLNVPNPAYLYAAYFCALLGAYVCLSVARTELHTWDMWFFRLAIMSEIIFVVVGSFVASSTDDPLRAVASDIGAIAAILSVLVWWLRSACWRTHPGLTFLLGASPAIMLFLSLPGIATGSANFFLTQVSLLCMILGLIRLIQGEIVQ